VSVKGLLTGAVPQPEWAQPLYQTLDFCAKFRAGEREWINDPPGDAPTGVSTSDEEQRPKVSREGKDSGPPPFPPSNLVDRDLKSPGPDPDGFLKLQNASDPDSMSCFLVAQWGRVPLDLTRKLNAGRSPGVDEIVSLLKNESGPRQPLNLGRDKAQEYANALNTVGIS